MPCPYCSWPFGRSLRRRQLPTTLEQLHLQQEEAAALPPYERALNWV